MTVVWPQKTSESAVAMVDSARWNAFDFRDDDIVVATYPKSGTTLTQQIVAQLVFDGDPDIFGAASHVSPWLEVRFERDALATAARQTHRRFIKTHLAVEHLVVSPRAKYIAVARDTRDMLWSFHNHQINFLAERIPAEALAGAFPDGQPPAPPSPDIREYYHRFLDGDHGEFPYWSHIQGWWDVRGLPNVLLLHYSDIIADLPSAILRIADFLGIPVAPDRLPVLAAHCSLEHMRRVASKDPGLDVFRGGARTFINKGVDGRWRDILSEDDSRRAVDLARRQLTRNCADWLMRG